MKKENHGLNELASARERAIHPTLPEMQLAARKLRQAQLYDAVIDALRELERTDKMNAEMYRSAMEVLGAEKQRQVNRPREPARRVSRSHIRARPKKL